MNRAGGATVVQGSVAFNVVGSHTVRPVHSNHDRGGHRYSPQGTLARSSRPSPVASASQRWVTMSVIESTTEQSDDAAAIMQLVTDSYRSSRTQIDRVLGRFDLSAMQYGLLRRIAQDPDITGAELARRVRVSAQAVQNQLALLEQRSLIRRTRNHGKKIKVRITPAGRQKLANAQPLVNAVQARFVESFDPNDRQVLRKLLSVYVTAAGDPRDS